MTRMSRKAAISIITSEVAETGMWTREAIRARVEAPISAATANAAAAHGMRIRAMWDRNPEAKRLRLMADVKVHS